MTRSTVSVQKLDPPVSAVPAGIPLGYDLSDVGYVEQEFVLDGLATSYRLRGGRGGDGHWSAQTADNADFTTRLVVRRPASADQFSGTVLVEWFNVSVGTDMSYLWPAFPRHMLREGHAWVGVSVQKAGLDGGGMAEGPHLKLVDPDRYGMLQHPGDDWSYDIFSQAGAMLRSPAASSTLELGEVRLVLGTGASQSASALLTYINAVDPLAAAYDGFFLQVCPARGLQLSGQPWMSPELLGPAAAHHLRDATLAAGPERVRDDARVPVLILQSESELILGGTSEVGQLDSEHVRLWEVAGSAHADTYFMACGAHDNGSLDPRRLAELNRPTTEALGVTTDTPINAGPQLHYVGQAALKRLEGWAAGGPPPLNAPRLQLAADGEDLVRDERGIACGGIRSPWVDVPTATLSGVGQDGAGFTFMFGRTLPFDRSTLTAIYPGGKQEYLGRFASALDDNIAAGFIGARDRQEILDIAAESFDMNLTLS